MYAHERVEIAISPVPIGYPSISVTILFKWYSLDRVPLMSDFQLSVKEKGRTVLPIGLQRACGFTPGSTLVARPMGNGRFVVETREAVLERIWSANPQSTPTDGVAELAQWRQVADAQRWERLASPDLPSEEISSERANQLLRELGL